MEFFLSIVIFLWESFKLWLSNIFVAPFTNLEALWILIPIYLGLVTIEFFQEKKETKFGNVISNSVVVLWGGIDFLRQTINGMDKTPIDGTFVVKMIIATIILAYGIMILVLGLKGKEMIKYFGRIKTVCYVVIIFMPLYYTSAKLTWSYIAGAILYFPIFYLVFYLIDRFAPDPGSLEKDRQTKDQNSSPPTF